MTKKILGFICLASLMIASPLMSQEATKSASRVVASANAEDFIGSTCVVTGKVAEVHASDKMVRLNFDNKFPKQSFTAVVFGPKTNLFAGLEKLEGKVVEVTGKISEYREKPQIVLTSTNQLKVMENR